MNRNLNQEEKEKIRDKYGEHVFFRLLNQSCKRYEREMNMFRFSPEDAFWESLNILDDLKAPNRNNDDMCDTLWDDLFCEFRERGNNIPDDELEKAVAVVLSIVTYCLVLLDSMLYNGILGKMNLLIRERYQGYSEILLSIDKSGMKINTEKIKRWLEEYMQCDTYLSEVLEDFLDEKEEEEEELDGNKIPNKVRGQLLLEILKLCGMGLDTQDTTKVARLVGFIIDSSSEKLRQQLSYNGALILKSKTHQKYVNEANKLLMEMGCNIKLKCE